MGINSIWIAVDKVYFFIRHFYLCFMPIARNRMTFQLELSVKVKKDDTPPKFYSMNSRYQGNPSNGFTKPLLYQQISALSKRG